MTDKIRISWYTSYFILSSLLLLIIMELSVRALYPEINYQGNQKSLFMENKFNQTMGLIPNSSGKFFGNEIYTDEYGFRQMNTPANYDKSWLFLGDSVTFGVGIEADRIFPQLIQNEFQRTKIWNTAAVGYSTLNYLDVAETFLRDHDDIKKIIIFFCLNDVYGNLSLNPASISSKEKILSFLRSNSKLYLLIKNSFFDRSKSYTLYDVGIYKERNLDIEKHLNAIVSIKSISDKLNIELSVVILPYEYQLRTGGLKTPQDLLTKFFRKNNIKSFDLYEDLTSLNSEEYYLYGDAMHLSSFGHKTVADKMVVILK